MADQNGRINLLDPVLDQGIENPNFFNGRLLTAGDLKAEQDADRDHRGQLGRAAGDGVVTGLTVTVVEAGAAGAPPVLRVAGGLALNRCGQPLALPTAADVVLAPRTDPAPADAGLFAPCGLPPAAPGTDRGAFLLVIGPASGYRGRAPRRGDAADAGVDGCGPRYAVEGVRFRLEPLDPAALAVEAPATVAADLAAKDRTDTAGRSLHRSLLAHLCFGTEPLAGFAADPFRADPDGTSPFDAYGAADALRAAGTLTDCEVPLALLYWPAAGVRFIDNWAVRRRLVQPLVGDPWPTHVGQRRMAEAEAVFLQFQDQLAALLARPNPAAAKARDNFAFLPPAGYLPVAPGQFTAAAFFTGLTTTPQQLDPAFLRLLIRQSFDLDPIDLTSPPPVRLFTPPGQPGYLLFVRDDVQPPPTDPPPPPPSGTKTGNIDVSISLLGGGLVARPGRIIRKAADLDAALTELGIADKTVAAAEVSVTAFQVYAIDAAGNRYNGFPEGTALQRRVRKAETVVFRVGATRYTIPGVPPGAYTVHVRAVAFKPASRQATVTAGQTTQVAVHLIPLTLTPGRPSRPPVGPWPPPPDGVIGTWINPDWFGKLFVIERPPQWPWQEDDPRDRFDPVVDPPPPEVEAWAEEWADRVAAAYPDAPVDPGGTRLVLSAAHTPDRVADAPYAYLVFGEGGAYLPVVMTAKDQTLDRPVALAAGAIPGVEAGAVDRFRDAGVTSLDALAAGWTGLVGEVLGVGTEAARGVVATARGRVGALRGTLRQFGGIDANQEAVLVAAGIDGPEALANADPRALAAGVGGPLALLLVDQARAAVSPALWSVASPRLGLRAEQVAALRADGVVSLGQLRDRTADAAGVSAVGLLLGVTDTTVSNLIGRIPAADAAKRAEVARGEAAATTLAEVDTTAGWALARLGVGSAARLAAADPAVLAAAFGGDVARATAAVNAAKLRIRGGP